MKQMNRLVGRPAASMCSDPANSGDHVYQKSIGNYWCWAGGGGGRGVITAGIVMD